MASISSVMVTGGCGFIGSNFVSHLLKETSATIVTYDSLSPASNKNYMVTSDRCVLVVGDICNGDLLEKTIQQHGIEAVVHFSALTHAGDSFKCPEAYIEANVRGTLCLLEAMKKYGHIRNFIYVSTDEVYGESAASDAPKNESSLLQPTNPYAASKVSAEKLVEVYHRAYGIPACFVRMCNVYGPKQSYDKVIPKFIKLAIEGKPFTIEGDGNQLRSWLYVHDACNALYSVLERGKLGEIYNLGTSSEVSVLELAKEIKKEVSFVLGRDTGKFETVLIPDRPVNDYRYYMDTSKIRRDLGWSEKMPFEEGLKMTVGWYMENLELKVDRERILVFEAGEWIGGQFSSLLKEQGIDFITSSVRIGKESAETVQKEVLSAAPSHVVTFTGSQCNTKDSPGKQACGSLYDAALLAQLCRKFKLHFTYLDSSSFFDGTEGCHPPRHRYTEDDVTNFCGHTCSGYMDRLMRHYENTLNVHIVFDGAQSEVFSQSKSLVKLSELLPVLLDLMKTRCVGTVHLSNHKSNRVSSH